MQPNQYPQQQYGQPQYGQPQQYQQYPQQQQFRQKTPQQIVSQLQYSINYYNINLQQLFQAYKTNYSAVMQYQEFSNLLLKIDPTLQPHEVQMTFQFFDKDGDRTLSFQEFDSQLSQMKQRGQQMLQGEAVLKKLKYSIDYHKINLVQLFQKYDQSRNNTIDRNEFALLIRRIDPQANDNDINAAFVLLDQDQSGHVNLQEFTQVLNQVQAGTYHSPYAPQQQQYQQQPQQYQQPGQYQQQPYQQQPYQQQPYQQQPYQQQPGQYQQPQQQYQQGYPQQQYPRQH